MEIKFTKEQFENLMKLAFLGNWVVNCNRLYEDRVVESDDLESYIYSFAEEGGLKDWVEYDEKLDRYYTSAEFEEDMMSQFLDEYDDEIFWNELSERLARRDFIQKYGEPAIHKMSREERFDKEQQIVDEYEEEFEKYGIDNLVLKK